MFNFRILNYRFRMFFVIFLSQLISTESRVKTNTEISCDKIQSQQKYSLSDMSGSWYGIEIMEHVHKGRPVVDSCIRVEIQHQDSNYVNLIWKERDFKVQYKFVILDQKHRGNWTSQGSQNIIGKPDGYIYEQFAGNVFIVKASDTNVVLVFCSIPNKLFSLVLSKTHFMNQTELDSIHNMIDRFVEPISIERRKYCVNEGSRIFSSSQVLSLFIIAIFTFRLKI